MMRLAGDWVRHFRQTAKEKSNGLQVAVRASDQASCDRCNLRSLRSPISNADALTRIQQDTS